MEAPGEKLVARLWETVMEKGVGALFRPWQIRREGRASIDVRREELLALAQAEKDADEIRAGLKILGRDGTLLLPAPTVVDQPQRGHRSGQTTLPVLRALPQVAVNGMVAEFLREEVNVAKALLHAESELHKDSQEPPDRTIDSDWLYRWRGSAAEVSSEELQHLWGQVLAGEIKSPGSFSLRTVEFLRNLSQEEAKKISLLSRFVMNDTIYSASGHLAAEGINFGFLLDMQELGLVSGVGGTGLETRWASGDTQTFQQVFLSNGKVLHVTHEEASRTIILSPVVKVTVIGREVLRLGTVEPHLPYLREIGQSFVRQGFRVTVGDYRLISETRVQYSGVEPLSDASTPENT